MPTPTYVALAKTVLTGTQSYITFSSILQTYTDLLLVVSARSSASALTDSITIEINGDATATYSYTDINGNGSTAASARSTSNAYSIFRFSASGNTATANTFGSFEVYYPNYTGSTNKPISGTGVSETNAATGVRIDASANLYSATGAITQLKLGLVSAQFVSGSRFDLYGIKNS